MGAWERSGVLLPCFPLSCVSPCSLTPRGALTIRFSPSGPQDDDEGATERVTFKRDFSAGPRSWQGHSGRGDHAGKSPGAMKKHRGS